VSSNSNFLPESFIERLKKANVPNFKELVSVIECSEPSVSVRFNRNKKSNFKLLGEPVEWCNEAIYLAERPLFTADPVFHAGGYYVQEASSMFLAEAIKQLNLEEPKVALDLCAAPGGKTTLLADALPENSLLLANEIIPNRAKILLENIIKWGAKNTLVTCSKPEKLGGLNQFFDLILVDAPCSGEGLFRKQKESVSEWSSESADYCAVRQQDIVSEIWRALKPGGFLVYSTCTYNPDENINNIAHWAGEYDAKTISLNIDSFKGIETVKKEGCIGYQFYPHQIKGEGFFLSVLQKNFEEDAFGSAQKEKTKNKKVNLKVADIPYLENSDSFKLVENAGFLCAFDKSFEKEIEAIKRVCTPFFEGFPVAEIKGKHVASSPYLPFFEGYKRGSVPEVELDLLEAQKFLRGETFLLKTPLKGWVVFVYNNIPIGLAKAIGNRFNNYFPKPWRIRMDLKKLA
jgi:16S rRNA C967 or C1407 C5-methylase (RsmB/RsmF family)